MLPQNLTFKSDDQSIQILYAGLVVIQNRIFLGLIISFAMNKSREGEENKWQLLNSAAKQKM